MPDFVIAALGEGLCFLINGISFLTVIAALLMMKIPPKVNNNKNEKVLEGVKEGIKYAYNFKPIRALLLLIGLVSLTGMPYTVLMPVFAKDILHGNSQTLGFLFGAVGSGSFDRSYLSCITKICFGFRKMDSYCCEHFFSRTFILFFFEEYLFVGRTYALHRIWNDDANGINKHFASNSC